MKYFITTIFILLMSLPCNAFSLFRNDNGIYRNDIANAEKELFGRRNTFHSQEQRLAILEKELFGSVQSGYVRDRVSLINRVLANRQAENIYISPSKINRIKRNIFSNRNYNYNDYQRNIRNYGRMTGFEPPIHQTTMPNYYNSKVSSFNNNYYRTQSQINKKFPQPYGYGKNRFSQRFY